MHSGHIVVGVMCIGIALILMSFLCSPCDTYKDSKEKNKPTSKRMLYHKRVRKCDVLDICSICLLENTKEGSVILAGCNHVYHKECILDWIKVVNKCPMCRGKVLTTVYV